MVVPKIVYSAAVMPASRPTNTDAGIMNKKPSPVKSALGSGKFIVFGCLAISVIIIIENIEPIIVKSVP